MKMMCQRGQGSGEMRVDDSGGTGLCDECGGVGRTAHQVMTHQRLVSEALAPEVINAEIGVMYAEFHQQSRQWVLAQVRQLPAVLWPHAIVIESPLTESADGLATDLLRSNERHFYVEQLLLVRVPVRHTSDFNRVAELAAELGIDLAGDEWWWITDTDWLEHAHSGGRAVALLKWLS